MVATGALRALRRVTLGYVSSFPTSRRCGRARSLSALQPSARRTVDNGVDDHAL